MKSPCPGFDLDDDKTKEVGGIQSFWHFLDTDPALSAFTKDVVLEEWIPYVLNITATPPARNQSALAAKLGN